MRFFHHADGNNPNELLSYLEKYATQKFESEKDKADYVKELYGKAVDFLETQNLEVNKTNIDAHIEAIRTYEPVRRTLMSNARTETTNTTTEEKKPCTCQEGHQEPKCYEKLCFWVTMGLVMGFTALVTYVITDYFKDAK